MFSLVFSSEMRNHPVWTSLSSDRRTEITDKINQWIFLFLSSKECMVLSEVNQVCNQANVTFQLKPYAWLQNQIRFPGIVYSFPTTIKECKADGSPQNIIDELESGLDQARKELPEKIYITDANGKRSIKQLGKILGRGKEKQAIELSGGQALIISILGQVYARPFLKHCWPRIVKEEVKMSKILTRVGLLSLCSQEVMLSFFENSKERTLPAYINNSFESLKEKGCFILNMTNTHASTWQDGVHYLFSSEEERLDEKNWDSVLDALLTDIAKICLYQIPRERESENLAVIKKSNDSSSCSSSCPYEIRYFGFDFCSKRGEKLRLPDIATKPAKLPTKEELNKVLSNYLLMFLQSEFFGKSWDTWQEVRDRLVERYEGKLFERAQQLFHEIPYHSRMTKS